MDVIIEDYSNLNFIITIILLISHFLLGEIVIQMMNDIYCAFLIFLLLLLLKHESNWNEIQWGFNYKVFANVEALAFRSFSLCA